MISNKRWNVLKSVEEVCCAADFLNEWALKIFCWLIIPLTLVVTIEVIMRYLFNRPTIWAWDISTQLLCAFSILGGGYALLCDAHVGVDVLAAKLSSKMKTILDLLTSLLALLTLGVFLWQGISEAWFSFSTREISSTLLGPPIYPLKIAMVVGVALLVLQMIARISRYVLKVKSLRVGGE